jgi:copper chaperone NosL
MRIALAFFVMLLVACSAEPPGPADLAFNSESCAFCRMVISDKRFPAQIVSPGRDPLFFDDLDCMAKHVAAHPLPKDAVVFVTDYKTSAWIRARDASFFRCANMASPMSSGVIATAKEGTPTFCPAVEAKELFGRELP